MPPPVGPRLSPQQITLLTQVGAALRGGNVAQAISSVDSFQGGDNSGAIDTNAEISALLNIVTARIDNSTPNRDQLLEAQRQILLNINELIPDEAQRARFFRNLATQMATNHPLRADPVINAQINWYSTNRNTTFNVGATGRQNIIQHLGGISLNADDNKLTRWPEGWQRNLRQNFHRAWTNDPQGILFISTQEYTALYMQARQEYQESTGSHYINEQEFNDKFNEILMASTREDTPFDPRLIATQTSMALCRSRFTGEGSEGLTRCLEQTNRLLWTRVLGEAAPGTYPPGSVLYTDQSGIPGHGHMVVFAGQGGQIEIRWVPPTGGARFDLDAQGGIEPGDQVGLGRVLISGV